MTVTVVVSFRAKPNKIDALLAFLTSIQPGVIEAGCRSISLLQDQSQPDCVFEIEHWDTAEQHQHMVEQAETSGLFAPFADLLADAIQVNYLNTIHYS